ncbi:MAG: Transcription initiation factor IIE subunit beta [Marteilia pararefringens]
MFSLKEICGQIGLTMRPNDFDWLNNHALQSNPKIYVDPDDITKFRYNPKYSFQNASELLLTLKAMQIYDGSGMLVEDIEECLDDTPRVLEKISTKIHILTKNKNKTQIVFYKDPEFEPIVDEEIQKLWRGHSLEGKDSLKIEQYLTKKGLSCLKDRSDINNGSLSQNKKEKSNKIRSNSKLFNTHLDGVLQDFSQ